MQEVDIDGHINLRDLDTAGYSLEVEMNSLKSRVGFYISKNIKYKRKDELEGEDWNIEILNPQHTTKSSN